jgi:type VI secretion system protein ImpA
MIVVEDLLQPISAEKPSGEDLKYDKVFADIKEARREDEDLKQGAWQTELKVADFPKVINLATTALKKRTKDLWIAAWLTEAVLRKEGFGEFSSGLLLLHGLVDKFWDTLYPEIDEGDLELRAAPLNWIGLKWIEDPIRLSPINGEGHGLVLYNESRKVGYEEQNKTPELKKKRDAILKEGKLAPELFDKSFKETPKAFYKSLTAGLANSLANLAKLGELCDEKFGNDSPAFAKVQTALEEVQHVARSLLAQKLKDDPDPVEQKPPEEVAAGGEQAAEEAGGAGFGAADGAYRAAGPAVSFSVGQSSESPGRRALVEQVAAAAAALRKNEPYSPAPYLMMRGLRWGDLRIAAALSDPNMLEAPPTEIRQQIKRLALAEKWEELLQTAEAVMALPCSRAWLDLQRFVVESCVALGSDYDAIAIAIRSELRSLLRDVPQLLDATLMDDTPAANGKTREWLKELTAEPGPATPLPSSAPLDEPPAQRWQKKYVDSIVLAKEAVKAGQPEKAIEIMTQELARQRSARGRFQRRLQFIDICVAAGKEAIVQPMLDDMIATIDAHKLEEWEDKSLIAAAIVTIMRASKKIQGAAAEKQKFFERVCRLDPAQALNC